ncbi:MAG: 5-formyltetrahydrofolate cyclo-ligase [Cyanobacteria bacterium J06600_6]
MSPLNKSSLRRNLLQQRQSLPIEEWQHKSNLICDRLKALTLFQSASTVLAYFSFRQEPDLSSLFTLDKNWAFPRCVDKSLVWHPWQPGDELQTGKYGIYEPLTTAPTIVPTRADLILVPTVASDNLGRRLGYGGGFYDRLLSSKSILNTPTIGITFDFACGVEIPIDPWDKSLDFVCTETNIYNY